MFILALGLSAVSADTHTLFGWNVTRFRCSFGFFVDNINLHDEMYQCETMKTTRCNEHWRVRLYSCKHCIVAFKLSLLCSNLVLSKSDSNTIKLLVYCGLCYHTNALTYPAMHRVALIAVMSTYPAQISTNENVIVNECVGIRYSHAYALCKQFWHTPREWRSWRSRHGINWASQCAARIGN